MFHIETDRLHFDTTSLMTYGAHDVPADLPGPRAVRGYSKDHRPDLLQWVFGMTVQRDGLPMVSTHALRARCKHALGDEAGARADLERAAALGDPEAIGEPTR